MTADSARTDPKGSVLVGLDGEMSGTGLHKGHKLIQAGLAVRVNGQMATFSSLIGWDDTELAWDLEAFRVHGIERDRVLHAPAAAQVDHAANTFLRNVVGPLEGRTLLSVGFNVGAFDHPFFRRTLPATMQTMSRRCIDLNSVCFALDGWGGANRSWQWWKNEACAWAGEQLERNGQAGGPHDAAWDAAQALYVLEFLRTQIHASGQSAG